jgi:hypothetical protein
MKVPVIIGLIGGIVIASLQFISMTNEPGGSFGWLLFYSPLIFYFMCIYVSIRRMLVNGELDWKMGLKAGGVTALLISLIWGIGIFVGITHTDVNALIQYKIQRHESAEIPHVLANFTRQGIFDQAKFFSMPNFLLGFAMTVLVTVVFRLRGKKAA